MSLRGRNNRGTERGATLVEFALVLPVFGMLLLGMITGGHAYFQKISITDAVREGARYGATLAGGIDDFNKWRNAVLARIDDLASGELSSSDSSVCVDLVLVDVDPTTPENNACGVPDPDVNEEQYVVKVSASRPGEIDLLMTSFTVTLRSEMSARYERTKG